MHFGIKRTSSQGRKMQDWKMADQFAELEDDGLNQINGKCRTDQGRRSITI